MVAAAQTASTRTNGALQLGRVAARAPPAGCSVGNVAAGAKPVVDAFFGSPSPSTSNIWPTWASDPIGSNIAASQLPLSQMTSSRGRVDAAQRQCHVGPVITPGRAQLRRAPPRIDHGGRRHSPAAATGRRGSRPSSDARKTSSRGEQVQPAELILGTPVAPGRTRRPPGPSRHQTLW